MIPHRHGAGCRASCTAPTDLGDQQPRRAGARPWPPRRRTCPLGARGRCGRPPARSAQRELGTHCCVRPPRTAPVSWLRHTAYRVGRCRQEAPPRPPPSLPWWWRTGTWRLHCFVAFAKVPSSAWGRARPEPLWRRRYSVNSATTTAPQVPMRASHVSTNILRSDLRDAPASALKCSIC